jgi:hypothetical protein
VNGEKAIGEGGGDVHRAAIHADHEVGVANEPAEFRKRGGVQKVDDVQCRGGPSFRAASDDDRRGSKGGAQRVDFGDGE